MPTKSSHNLLEMIIWNACQNVYQILPNSLPRIWLKNIELKKKYALEYIFTKIIMYTNIC